MKYTTPGPSPAKVTRLTPSELVAVVTGAWAMVGATLCAVLYLMPPYKGEIYAPLLINYVGMGGVTSMVAMMIAMIVERHSTERGMLDRTFFLGE